MRLSPREIVERNRLLGDEKNDIASLWISDRVLRLAEYQDVVERVNDQIAELRDVTTENPYDPMASAKERAYFEAWESNPPKPGRIPAMLLKMKIEALRTAAEELGQLPNELPPATQDAVYHVVGISQDELRRGLT